MASKTAQNGVCGTWVPVDVDSSKPARQVDAETWKCLGQGYEQPSFSWTTLALSRNRSIAGEQGHGVLQRGVVTLSDLGEVGAGGFYELWYGL